MFQQSDPVLGVVINAVKKRGINIPLTDPVLRQWSKKRKFLTVGKEDGLLNIRYRIGKRVVNQLVVPTALIPNVLRLKHDEAGHMGAAKTTKLIRREYFWLTMVKDAQQYCRSCVTCASSRPAPSHRCTRLTLSSQPQEPWQEIAIVIKGPFGTKPNKRGNRYVLVVIDLLTRAADVIPIPDKSAKTVARAIIRDVFCRRGIPESLLTDRGCEFDNLTLTTIAHELGIDKKRISALHPQANGTVERLNRTIGDMLRKSTNERGEDWDLEIPFVLFNYMNQDHEATGYSPFFLSHGYFPRTPRLVVAPPLAKSQQPASQWAATLSSRLKEAHSGAQTRDLQMKQSRVADSQEECSELHIGDTVMMHVPSKPGSPSKLQNRWQGPYVVVKCLQGNTYRIKHQENFRKRFLRHRDQLRVINTRPERLRHTPVTLQTEDSPTALQTRPQNDDSPTQGTTTQENSVSSRTATAIPQSHAAREETDQDTAMEEQQTELTNMDETNPEACSTGPERHEGSRVRRPPLRYGWELNSLLNYQ